MRNEKQGEALLDWMRDLVINSVKDGYGELTLRQDAVLLITYLDDGRHTVRGLAEKLNVSRPVISRALDRLGGLGLTRRQTDPLDRRSIVVRRTRKGRERIQSLVTLIGHSYQQLEGALPSAAAAAAEVSKAETRKPKPTTTRLASQGVPAKL